VFKSCVFVLNLSLIVSWIERECKSAGSNTKEQFANSPDLNQEITNAIIDALDAHTEMSTQALGSDLIQQVLREILLNHARLYEELRGRSTSA
jgi:type I restriction enzyme R subunit